MMCLVGLCAVGTVAGAAESKDLSSSLYRLDLMQAEGGNPDAQYSLGGRFEEGRGVGVDLTQAVQWYRRAADQGHAPAQFRLAQLHEQGRGLPRDERQALSWYTAAAEQGYQAATDRLQAIVAERQQRAAEAKARKQAQRAAEATARQQAQRAAEKKAAQAAIPPATEPVQAEAPHFPHLRDTLLAAKWYHDGEPAQVLPSPTTNCLASGSDEIVCFTRELQRRLGEADLTYIAKTTLQSFDELGRFELAYLFNVTRMRGRAGGRDADGLQARAGWQEPGMRLRCRAQDARRLHCEDRASGGNLEFVAR